MKAAVRLGLLLAPVASGFQFLESSRAYSDEISAISSDADDASKSAVVLDEISAERSTEAQSALLDEIGAEQQQNPAAQALASAPKEGGVALLESGSFGHSGSVGHSGSFGQSGSFDHAGDSLRLESNRHLFTASTDEALVGENMRTSEHAVIKKAILEKVAKGIVADQRNAFAHLSYQERVKLANLVANESDTSFIDVLAPPSPMSKPVLVPPHADYSLPRADLAASFIESTGSSRYGSVAEEGSSGDFAPSAAFQTGSDSGELAEANSGLPWGVGSPRNGDSLPNFHYSSMPAIDVPKEWEYSLDSGDNIQSFSSAQQDVKLITQVFENITNGFYLDTNAADGEHSSNTLLLELAGWRGLIMEPRGYWYLRLWGKMRKAWLFLGCISPHQNSTKIGFDTDGNIDMLSGHMIHAYNMKDFMAEMGGRKTIDFWNLHSGGYEAEILNETLLGVGSFIEFGVILVRFDGRRTGRGNQPYVQMRSKDETEEIIFEILHNASFKYIGGLDAYWINHVSPRFHYNDVVWVNPSYFAKRGIPMPTQIKAAPPPPLNWPGNQQDHFPYRKKEQGWPLATEEYDHYWPGFGSWDYGFNSTQEIEKVVSYFKKSKVEAASREPVAKAHRVMPTKLVY